MFIQFVHILLRISNRLANSEISQGVLYTFYGYVRVSFSGSLMKTNKNKYPAFVFTNDLPFASVSVFWKQGAVVKIQGS